MENRILQVAENTLRDTVICRNNFSCLSGVNECLCEVQYCFRDDSHFVKPNNILCDYKVSFGNSFICSCPTRKEIYDRYRI